MHTGLQLPHLQVPYNLQLLLDQSNLCHKCRRQHMLVLVPLCKLGLICHPCFTDWWSKNSWPRTPLWVPYNTSCRPVFRPEGSWESAMCFTTVTAPSTLICSTRPSDLQIRWEGRQPSVPCRWCHQGVCRAVHKVMTAGQITIGTVC